MKALHSMNKLRVPFIRDGLVNSGQIAHNKIKTPVPLEGLSVLDVGCGGGILSEPLARLGCNVTGLDANTNLIELAKQHAEKKDLKINYVASSIEEHSSQQLGIYDAVVASEIIEHVTQKSEFVDACVKCLKPNGSIFITTLSKTNLAYFAGILISENLLNLLPKGTHQFEKFIEPGRLQKLLEDCNCRTELIHGMYYNIFRNSWHWCPDTSINYVLQAVKLKTAE
nr:unnamed protein product [Callosobruchus chinensis]